MGSQGCKLLIEFKPLISQKLGGEATQWAEGHTRSSMCGSGPRFPSRELPSLGGGVLPHPLLCLTQKR